VYFVLLIKVSYGFALVERSEGEVKFVLPQRSKGQPWCPIAFSFILPILRRHPRRAWPRRVAGAGEGDHQLPRIKLVLVPAASSRWDRRNMRKTAWTTSNSTKWRSPNLSTWATRSDPSASSRHSSSTRATTPRRKRTARAAGPSTARNSCNGRNSIGRTFISPKRTITPSSLSRGTTPPNLCLAVEKEGKTYRLPTEAEWNTLVGGHEVAIPHRREGRRSESGRQHCRCGAQGEVGGRVLGRAMGRRLSVHGPRGQVQGECLRPPRHARQRLGVVLGLVWRRTITARVPGKIRRGRPAARNGSRAAAPGAPSPSSAAPLSRLARTQLPKRLCRVPGRSHGDQVTDRSPQRLDAREAGQGRAREGRVLMQRKRISTEIKAMSKRKTKKVVPAGRRADPQQSCAKR